MAAPEKVKGELPDVPGPLRDGTFNPVEGLTWMDAEAIRHLKEAVGTGKEWHLALLEAMGMWSAPEEQFKGRHYRYLVAGEAFDWLLLAERLCAELDGVVPTGETEALLFHGRLPMKVSHQEFQRLVGFNKHQAVLNFWYGVVVEEALQLATEDDVRKRHKANGFSDHEDLVEEAFRRIYEKSRSDLLDQFLKESVLSPEESLGLTDVKEFTYWLFKTRVKFWDPARVGSDTRKGLEKLSTLRDSASFLAF